MSERDKQRLCELTTKFNILARRLVLFYSSKYPNDGNVEKQKRRAMIIINEQPLESMRIVGTRFFKFKDIIYSGKFHTMNEDEGKKYCPKGAKDVRDSILNNITSMWNTLSREEKDNIKKWTQKMLDIYVCYMSVLTEDKEAIQQVDEFLSNLKIND